MWSACVSSMVSKWDSYKTNGPKSSILEATNFLGHTPGLGYKLSDPHDVGCHVVDGLLLLDHLQLVQQLRNKNIQVLH